MKQEFNYELKGKEWVSLQDEAFTKVNKNAKIDGFRPGKAPRSMYEKKYGKQDILYEAADMAIKKEYERILTKEKIMPVIEPKVDLVKCDDKELKVNFIFVTEPKVTLGAYTNLGVKRNKVKVTKEEIDDRIHHLLEDYAEVIVKESNKVESGDTVIIDFKGMKDGVAFDGGTAENYSLTIGSNTFIPGFEDAVIGMKRGEEKDINLTFPKDYMAEELKGQKVVFHVKVNEIKTRVVPTLDKDFFDDLNMENVTNETELRHEIEHEIEHQKEHEEEHVYEEKCLEAAAKEMKADICDELVDDEVEHMYNEFMQRMAMQGVSEEMYYEYTKTKKEDITKQMAGDALKRIQYRYLLNEVIKTEKLKVTDKEAKDRLKEMASMYQVDEETILKDVSMDNIKFDILYSKALEIVTKNETKKTTKKEEK